MCGSPSQRAMELSKPVMPQQELTLEQGGSLMRLDQAGLFQEDAKVMVSTWARPDGSCTWRMNQLEPKLAVGSPTRGPWDNPDECVW